MAKARKGRGQLSAIERLPEECNEIITWASDELRGRERTQLEIYEEFFIKMEQLQAEYRGELEFKIPSFSAFNRHSIKLATFTRRMEQTSEIASAVASRFDAEKSDDLTLIAAEAIKTLVFEVLTDAGESGVDPKGAMQLAAALKSATQAQGVSTARRVKVNKDLSKSVDEALDKVQKEAGLDDATIAKLRRDFLGIKEEAKSDD